jgi:transposase
MSDIRQQIALRLDAYKDLQALKPAVSEWINQSDVTLPTLEKILAAHSPVDIPHEQVSEWLSSIGTDHEQPCPN